jgi:hypothetical protein
MDVLRDELGLAVDRIVNGLEYPPSIVLTSYLLGSIDLYLLNSNPSRERT